jgi:tetratricopeptide (TPR) repeat protein
MRVLLRFVLLCSIAMAHYPGHAQADPPAVTPDVKAKAGEYVAQGLAAQEAGDYDAAIGFYTKAHQLTQHPVLLFNIAQAHRLAGRIDQALAHYQKYLDADPKGAQARTARELVAELEARKAEEARRADDARKLDEARKAEEARKLDEWRRADEARTAEEVRRLEAARRAEEARVEQARKAEAARNAEPPGMARPINPPVEVTATSTTTPPPGRNLRIAGLLSGGTALIAFSVGIGFGLRAQGIDDELSRPMAPYSRDKEADGKRANQIAITGYVSSAVLLAVGATLYLLGESRDRHERSVAIAPVVSEQLTGLAISGSLP